MTNLKTNNHTVDARGRALGRVATEIANLLIGKNLTDSVRNKVSEVQVTVEHASKMLISEKKRTQKTYQRYSGYPGGQKTLSMGKIIELKGHSEILRMAVYGMLPHNRLRAERMKKLTIQD